MSAIIPIPAAQYLRMSTEHQQYSLDFQRAVIQSYAERNNFIVVQTYTDAGKSGLALKHREGLALLLHNIVAGEQAYKAVLVYDVSRWGRFQDTDEAAHYEFLCRQSGVPIHYCAETFSNEITMPNAIMKALKRVMAAEYSRELSEKVFHSMTQMVLQGLWTGSQPGYGLRRMLVSSDGQQKHLLKYGERKNIRSDRTIVVPGPAEEVDCVREIFRMYIRERRSTTSIARELNQRGVTRGGKRWNYQAVRKILSHEKYTGSLVWGQWTQKLSGRTVPVSREKWIVQPGALEPIVSRRTFNAAQRIRENKPWHTSDKDLLDKVRSVIANSGRVTAKILNESPITPSATCYIARFGSLRRMYQLLNYTRTDTFKFRMRTQRHVTALHRAILHHLQRLFPDVRATHESRLARPKTLRFSSGLEVSLNVCLAEKTLMGAKRWRFQSVNARCSGLITLMCLCNANNSRIHRFIVLPSVAHIHVVSLLSENDERLAVGIRLTRLSEFRTVAHSIDTR